jgi:3-oxoadipate enol-lactonase
VPYATANGVELYYEVDGEGPRLLFISGSMGDLRTHGAPFSHPGLAAFTVARYDQRGLGRSAKPDVAYTMADYADDAAALLDTLGWDTARVLGVSFGGMVAQELALRHPQKVERLLLACTSSGGAGGASYPLHLVEPSLGSGDVTVLRGLLDTRPEEAEKLAAAMASVASPPLDADARAGIRRQLEARAGHDTWDRLPRIACPTLVAAGRYDGIAPPENAVALASRIPDARLAFFEGGHAFMLQDPTAWPTMLTFLEGPLTLGEPVPLEEPGTSAP